MLQFSRSKKSSTEQGVRLRLILEPREELASIGWGPLVNPQSRYDLPKYNIFLISEMNLGVKNELVIWRLVDGVLEGL